MINLYIEVLSSLELEPVDAEVVERYKANPNGRVFLSVAEILRKYGHEGDSMQLLVGGVRLHPSYSAARVELANRYFESSMFLESLKILEDSPVSLKENKVAQSLKFRLCLILGFSDKLMLVQDDMRARHQLDNELSTIIDDLNIRGFEIVRRDAINKLHADGLVTDILDSPLLEEEAASTYSLPQQEGEPAKDPALLGRLIEGFYAAPISQIFQKSDHAGEEIDQNELDAVTLARVYRKQGRYEKSLEIYQRLLYMAPNNDMFKIQIEELKALKDEQRQRELGLDSELVERIDSLQVIESRVSFLQDLLVKLDDKKTS